MAMKKKTTKKKSLAKGRKTAARGKKKGASRK
jgi:hypothetical protein